MDGNNAYHIRHRNCVMKRFLSILIIMLVVHIIEHVIYIKIHHTMSMDYKIWSTGIKGVVLLVAFLFLAKSEVGNYWKGLLLIPFAIGAWALCHDFFMGLILHGNPFYLSVNTWPDKRIVTFVHNGYLYTLFKLCYLAVIGYYPIHKWYK